jgi:hypothetical protein
MATYTYPSNDLEKARTLLGLLGSHWVNVYQGNSVVQGYAFARAQEEIQSYQDLLETIASISRIEVPIYHTDNWYLLTLRESDLNSQLLQYGGGAVYGVQPDGSTYHYGTANPNALGQGYKFPIPEDLKDARLIFNRLTEPSLSLVKGIDFVLDADSITFSSNPFVSELVPKRDVYTGTEVTDREAGLWIFRGQFDWDHVYTHFGYVLSLKLASSSDYRDLINAILDSFVEGTAEKHIQLGIAAITSTPIVVEPTETVELVQEDDDHLVIATDANVYKFPTTADAIVEPGDVLSAGDQLVDTVTFYNLNGGDVPSDLFAVHLGLGYLPGGFIDGLTFQNTTVPLEVDVSTDKTRVSFEIGGLPTDVDLFWDMVHERGVLDGTTLANLLDLRDDPTTEPLAGSLPATINPLQFLIENVLRYNAYIVRIRVSKTDGTIPLGTTRLFRKVVPPWTAMIVLLELDAEDDPVIMDGDTGAGDETTPGYDESVSTFTGATPITETVDPAVYITETVALRLVSGICR